MRSYNPLRHSGTPPFIAMFKPIIDLRDTNVVIQGRIAPENKNIKVEWAQRADQITHNLSAEEEKIIDEIKSKLESEYFLSHSPK